MNVNQFKNYLKEVYIKDPCKVLPNALWKTFDEIQNHNFYYEESENNIRYLELFKDNRVLFFWNSSEILNDRIKKKINNADFVLINDIYINEEIIKSFNYNNKYFRLIHYPRKIYDDFNISRRYEIKNFNHDKDIKRVRDFINKCYENINVNEEQVKEWIKHRVFKEDLWIWVIDREENNQVGLGIAALDTLVSEASLEWIQVSPDYRKQGIGQFIVMELLRRVKDIVAFYTVSGEINNNTKPEKLYRKCGFVGDNIWWLLKNRRHIR